MRIALCKWPNEQLDMAYKQLDEAFGIFCDFGEEMREKKIDYQDGD